MKKGTVLFPLFTARQTETNIPSKPNKSVRLKSKESSSLLKMMNQDIKRIKQSRAGKTDKTDILIKNIQNKNKRSSTKIIEKTMVSRTARQIPSLQIRKIAKTQTYKTIIPQITFGTGTGRKATAVSIEAKRSSMNMKLSGQRGMFFNNKVIVAKNRKEFSKINEELIYDRRENYLNAKFNDRVNRLNAITKQNKRIYDRINSQRSHYSNDELNKSYESNASISKRLSNSKISRRSRLSMSSERSVCSSRCSIASKKSAKYLKNQEGLHSKEALKSKAAPKRLIKIESKNINELKVEQFENFATLFTSASNKPLESRRIVSKTARKYNQSDEFKQNLETAVQSKQKISLKLSKKEYRLPSLGRSSNNISKNGNKQNPLEKQNSPSIRKRILSAIDENAIGSNLNLCNVLHKIVEEPLLPIKRTLNPSMKG